MLSKHTKLFYQVVARLRMMKPDYLMIEAISKRFKVSFGRAFNVREELKAVGIVKEVDLTLAKPGSNINYDLVKRVKVPSEITETVRKM